MYEAATTHAGLRQAIRSKCGANIRVPYRHSAGAASRQWVCCAAETAAAGAYIFMTILHRQAVGN